jgi:hypothetical protein
MPATDSFSNQKTVAYAPATNAVAVTANDSADLSYVTRAIYVGNGGNVKVDMQDSGTVIFLAVPTGMTLPIRAKRVYATGTTATSIIALW